jgi:hypothetical protein
MGRECGFWQVTGSGDLLDFPPQDNLKEFTRNGELERLGMVEGRS